MNPYETVTDRILAQLDAGSIPWRKTWNTGLPVNLSTGREYRGINILVLAVSGYRSRYWLTYRQAEHLGGHVRSGEKATPVVYWKWRTPDELKKEAAARGKTDLPRCVPFKSALFNLEQTEGIVSPEDGEITHDRRRMEIADRLMDAMPDRPEIQHATGLDPAYLPRLDRILLPHLSQFTNAAEYYATLFHELVHSTGHGKRLNRFQDFEGDRFEQYSFEELVAEFGASFLCGFAGLENPKTEQLQASYIAGWAEVFRKDRRILLRAASAAQRAADYIRGKVIAEASPMTE